MHPSAHTPVCQGNAMSHCEPSIPVRERGALLTVWLSVSMILFYLKRTANVCLCDMEQRGNQKDPHRAKQRTFQSCDDVEKTNPTNSVKDSAVPPKSEFTANLSADSIPEVKQVPVTEFMNAASQGNLEIVNKYLSYGGNPDVHDELNRTALHLACLEGHPPVVLTLLSRGADFNFPDRLGSMAVHWACRGGSLRVVQALKSHGADLNVRDKLWSTPLHVATRTGHIVIVEYLLSCGANINATDWEGDTALHDAVRLNRYKVVKTLVVAGADSNLQNNEGKTAVQQVKQWQFDILDTLHTLLKPQTSASTSQ